MKIALATRPLKGRSSMGLSKFFSAIETRNAVLFLPDRKRGATDAQSRLQVFAVTAAQTDSRAIVQQDFVLAVLPKL